MAIQFREIEGHSRAYLACVGGLALLIAIGLYAAHFMEQSGHHVTGMSNQIVWGMPHVFAVFLIIAASGALNVASMASVFSRQIYKPLSRLSVLVAISLLVGGLAVLVLDLGRPDRLIVAMTHYNFKSIFGWNMFLYTGFILIALVYLWTLMEGRLGRHTRAIGTIALIWRLILTTGTGCIFGFLVARQAYDAAIMAPLFIAMSLAQGLAVFVLIAVTIFRFTDRALDPALLQRVNRLLALFIWAVLYIVIAQHLTNLYATEHHGIEKFLLLEGGVYTVILWLGQVLLGSALPLFILYRAREHSGARHVVHASALVVLGGFSQLYVLIIAAQAYPQLLFADKVVLQSSFFDGVVASYTPSAAEILLGIGGVAIALLIISLGLKVLRFLPDSPVAVVASDV